MFPTSSYRFGSEGRLGQFYDLHTHCDLFRELISGRSSTYDDCDDSLGSVTVDFVFLVGRLGTELRNKCVST